MQETYSNNPSIQVGDEHDVTIEAVGEKGDGLARINGFVIFVPNTQAGEKCKIRVSRVLRKVGFGEKIEGSNQPVVKTSANVCTTCGLDDSEQEFVEEDLTDKEEF